MILGAVIIQCASYMHHHSRYELRYTPRSPKLYPEGL